MTPKEVRIYRTKDGVSPFHKWFASLRDQRRKDTIDTRLGRLQKGLFGDFKNIGPGVYELRIHYGAGIRVYFGLETSTIIILLCGGDKGSQTKDIFKAIGYWMDYKRRTK